MWFPGPRIHISGSHRPSGDLGPSPCPLWSFRGPAAARTRVPPCSLWVGTSIIIQMSGSQIIKLRNVCGVHWAMITWVPRRPRRLPCNAAVCSAVCKCHPPPGDRWNIQWNMNPILMLNGMLTTPLSMRCCTGLSPFRISLWNMDAICFLNICVIH